MSNSFFLIASLFLHCVAAAPSISDWKTLNSTIGGNLIQVTPPAEPCHQATYDAAACSIVKENWITSSWRSEQAGAMQFPTWEQANGQWCAIGNLNSTAPISAQCAQGNVPSFGVNASTVSLVQSAVNFARTHRIRMSVKGTGHDLLGRSTHSDTLLVWTHNMKNITVRPTTVCGKHFESITVGAGVQWGEAYSALGAAGRVVPGGGDPDVGASGGQPLGGGHSPLSNTYGLTTDSIIEFEVVTMDGRARTVSACENSDLFWALRGGGGGTYAIVTSTTFQTYPDGPVMFGSFTANVTADGYRNAFEQIATSAPSLAENGWSGYFYNEVDTFFGLFFLPLINNRTATSSNATFQSLVLNMTTQEGFTLLSASTVPFPSFLLLQQTVLGPSDTGSNVVYGSRLIPKAMLQNAASRQVVVDTISSVRNIATVDKPPLMLGHLLSGGAPSVASNSAVLPAWRTGCLHMLVVSLVPENSTKQEIDQITEFVTDELVEPMRKITPGGGAYMNEADSQAPHWKEDYFGKNYPRLLSIKLKYDPNLLLRCNRCVGSDL